MTTAYDGVNLIAMLIQEAYDNKLAERKKTSNSSERVLIDGWAAGLRQALALCTKAKGILNDRREAEYQARLEQEDAG